MMNKPAFYAHLRSKFGPLTQSQVEGIETLLATIEGQPLSYCSYMLATAWHETAETMEPIREKGGPIYFKRMYDPEGERPKLARSMGNTKAGDGVRYHGRGYVQLTWETNYRKADEELARAKLMNKGELLRNPDRAMEPKIAAFIMLHGMLGGWFSGKSLSDYLPAKGVATRAEYVQARRIINGTDRAELVEDYAQVFEKALRNAGVSA
jgi:putative chitinase